MSGMPVHPSKALPWWSPEGALHAVPQGGAQACNALAFIFFFLARV